MSEPNWLGLLKWSLGHSDGTNTSEFHQMSTEDKNWLETVMKEGVRDDPKRMNEVMMLLKDLLSESRPVPETLGDDLLELRDIVEQVDMAQVFTKFGGCEYLLQLIHSAIFEVEIKILATSIIATVSQNNISVQDALFKSKMTDQLSALFITNTNENLTNKLLYAISCVIRGHATAEEYFIEKFGISVFTKALQSSLAAVISRTLFLANALITSDYSSESRINQVVDTFMPRLFHYLLTEDVNVRENLYNLLLSFLQTQSGWSLISSNYAHQLSSYFENRKKELSEDQDADIEISTIDNLERKLSHLELAYPSKIAEQNRKSATLAKSITETSNDTPVLLIAQPSPSPITP